MSEAYVFKESIFKKIYTERPVKVPDKPQIEVKIEGQVLESKSRDNHLEVHLRIVSLDDCPIDIDLEVVAFFERLVEETDLSVMADFVNRQALPTLFTIIRQQIIVLTSQMGMSPVKLNAPHQYNVHPEACSTLDG